MLGYHPVYLADKKGISAADRPVCHTRVSHCLRSE